MNHLKIGALGEEIALNFLKKNKYKYIDRNYSKKFGEIDLIMQKRKILYFVEVKTMTGPFSRDLLIEKIHRKKLSRLKNVIHVYLDENGMSDRKWRFSAALVSINHEDKKAEIEFIENLF